MSLRFLILARAGLQKSIIKSTNFSSSSSLVALQKSSICYLATKKQPSSKTNTNHKCSPLTLNINKHHRNSTTITNFNLKTKSNHSSNINHSQCLKSVFDPQTCVFGLPLHSKRNFCATDVPPDPTEFRPFTAGLVTEDEAHKQPLDTGLTFELLFAEISRKMGGDQYMRFPKDIMWLAGAPGAGKGDMSKFIQEYRGYAVDAIRTSDLVTGAEGEQIKADGKLVSDRIIVKLLLERLLLPKYKTGVIVDGFPRTKLQAETIKLLFDKMLWLRRKFEDTEHFTNFRRPKFHVTVLYVGRTVSIERQLSRGTSLFDKNLAVERTGVGALEVIRETDLSEEKARQRYQFFLDHIFSSLQVIKEKFPFHFINAEASKDVVIERIKSELTYQSTSELADETYEIIRELPIATEIKREARQQLVLRLDSYINTDAETKALFLSMIDLFRTDFLWIIHQQALTGTAVINTENKLFREKPIALTMMLDIMAERGYKVILDINKREVPQKIDLQTGEIQCLTKRIFKFHISFPSPNIRGAVQSYESEGSVL